MSSTGGDYSGLTLDTLVKRYKVFVYCFGGDYYKAATDKSTCTASDGSTCPPLEVVYGEFIPDPI